MTNIDIVVFFARGRTDRQPANPNRGVRPLFRFEHVSPMWRIFLMPARDDKRNIHVNDWRRSIMSHSANAFSYVIHLSHATGVTVLEHKCWSNRLTDQSSLWHQYDIFQWTSVWSQTVLLFIGKEKDLHLVMRAPPMGSLGKKFNQWSRKEKWVFELQKNDFFKCEIA